MASHFSRLLRTALPFFRDSTPELSMNNQPRSAVFCDMRVKPHVFCSEHIYIHNGRCQQRSVNQIIFWTLERLHPPAELGKMQTTIFLSMIVFPAW
jgi:hypothetical protein